jgi:hypothetical protein
MTGLGSRTASHNGRLTADGKYSILGGEFRVGERGGCCG